MPRSKSTKPSLAKLTYNEESLALRHGNLITTVIARGLVLQDLAFIFSLNGKRHLKVKGQLPVGGTSKSSRGSSRDHSTVW